MEEDNHKMGENSYKIEQIKRSGEKVSQEQLYDLLTSRELSWQEIIYDLVNSEQLDPWDVDLALLTRSYIDKIHQLEETSFFISSKILFAAAILLRIKSEFLLDRYIKSVDEILFGKPQPKEKVPFEFDMEEVDLLPRTPLPRFRKVTLQELMAALNKAMVTEQRRIKKEISIKQALFDAGTVLPRRTINIKEKLKEIYQKIIEFFSKKEAEEMTFTQLVGENKEEKILTFVPLLHLDYQEKVMLNQPEHFKEIFIRLKQ